MTKTMNKATHCVHELWDELATLDPGDSTRALTLPLSRLCQLLDAQQAYWMGAVKTAIGWRGMVFVELLRTVFSDRWHYRLVW